LITRPAPGERTLAQKRVLALPPAQHRPAGVIVHGHYAPGKVRLRPELLGELQEAVTDRLGLGPRFDFVFHGGSGSTPEEIRAAVANGVVKMNVDTDMQYAFTRAAIGGSLAVAEGLLTDCPRQSRRTRRESPTARWP
jgi:hypothetical protein